MDKQGLRELLGRDVMGWTLQAISESAPVEDYPFCTVCGRDTGYPHWPNCSYMLNSRKWISAVDGQSVTLVGMWKPDEDLNQAFRVLEYFAFQNAVGFVFDNPCWEVTGEGIRWKYGLIIGTTHITGYSLAEVICDVVAREYERTH